MLSEYSSRTRPNRNNQVWPKQNSMSLISTLKYKTRINWWILAWECSTEYVCYLHISWCWGVLSHTFELIHQCWQLFWRDYMGITLHIEMQINWLVHGKGSLYLTTSIFWPLALVVSNKYKKNVTCLEWVSTQSSCGKAACQENISRLCSLQLLK